MKKALLVPIFVMAAALPALAADSLLQQGMKLYQQHHYNEATHLLYNRLENAEANQKAPLQLSFGMACLANARCYAQLYQAALAVQHDYLKRLVATKVPAKNTSQLAALYMGKAHIASGDLQSATLWLERFLASPGLASGTQIDAQVALGMIYHLRADPKKAQKTWSKVPVKNPEAQILMAVAYQQAAVPQKQPAQMADTAMAQLTAAGKSLSIQSETALLAIYTQANQMAKGFKILAQTDLKAFAHEEILGAHKTIHFYDPALLIRLSDFYNHAAVEALQTARQAPNAKIQSAATYYLGEAFSQMGRATEAIDAFNQFIAGNPKPQSIKQRAQVRQLFLQTQLSPPSDPLASLARFKIPEAGPALTSEVLQACSEWQINCPGALNRATALWQQSKGRAPVNISMALGRHFRQQGQYAKALRHLEGGRDKSRKNRIETNPPVMLIDLARGYYNAKQFSEALEIYFEMSKQFPAVRQIQVALQGVYAMEEQSAGDAKIF